MTKDNKTDSLAAAVIGGMLGFAVGGGSGAVVGFLLGAGLNEAAKEKERNDRRFFP